MSYTEENVKAAKRMGKQSKIGRVLDLYTRLCAGETVRKEEEAQRFQVNLRSVQRDIDEIRAYLSDRRIRSGDSRQVVYERKKKGFLLVGSSSPIMSNSEILAVSKILLDSRAFSKEEMSNILNKLMAGCVPYKNMKLVSELLANEKHHYAELSHPAGVPEKLWKLGESISGCRLLEITYQRQDTSQPAVERIIAPVGLQFSEYYFYLHAYILHADETGTLNLPYDYPAVFRVDRILSCRERAGKFTHPYSSRFQEGEFRKRVQFMYAGVLQRIRFRYTGSNVDAVLDRLPTAEIKAREDKGWIIEAEVYGKGILMWLLSQGTAVEVLSPPELRQEMKEKLQEILVQYG